MSALYSCEQKWHVLRPSITCGQSINAVVGRGHQSMPWLEGAAIQCRGRKGTSVNAVVGGAVSQCRGRKGTSVNDVVGGAVSPGVPLVSGHRHRSDTYVSGLYQAIARPHHHLPTKPLYACSCSWLSRGNAPPPQCLCVSIWWCRSEPHMVVQVRPTATARRIVVHMLHGTPMICLAISSNASSMPAPLL